MDKRQSPTPSCSSADEALFELIGVSELTTNEDTKESSSDHKPSVEVIIPPDHCLRPDISHPPFFLLLRNALSSSQCSYIIDRGYKVSNDGGRHFGPCYVKEASHVDSSMRVQLDKPNHHKVCVFKDEMILTWLRRFVQEMAGDYIRKWWPSSITYTINPRLRLLRYDAADNDVFLPHYDATTTMTQNGQPLESKLTILCYLNSDFIGGETLFLNGLHPDHAFVSITPEVGQVVMFNHELYHSSNVLQYDRTLNIQQPNRRSAVITGGTKFVLRSDVMFEQQSSAEVLSYSNGVMDTEPTEVALLSTILANYSNSQQETVLDIFGDVPTRVFLVPGREKLSCMLTDLGFADCDRFLDACEASLE